MEKNSLYSHFKSILGELAGFFQKRRMSYDYFHKSMKVSYGEENNDKTFYIVRREHYGGLFSDVQMFVGHLAYADKKGWIPVIDRLNYGNKWYQTDEEIGKANAWDLYFKQPMGYGLEDIAYSKNIVLSNTKDVLPWDRYDFTDSKTYFDLEFIIEKNRIFKKYIKLNTKVEEYVNSELARSLGNRKNVLGVICRYGYNVLWAEKKTTIHNHPRQPEIGEIIDKVKECMEKWGCEYVFLATDYSCVEVQFKDCFGDKLLVNTGHTFLENGLDGLKDDGEVKKVRGLEYIANIYGLARCDNIVCGMNGGAATAIILNGGAYKHKYVFELGRYVIPDFKGFED